MSLFWALIAAIGGCCFAFAALPTALNCLRTGKPSGTPASISWAIFAGCICLYAYLTAKHGFDALLTLVYGVETFSWGIVLVFHYLPAARDA